MELEPDEIDTQDATRTLTIAVDGRTPGLVRKRSSIPTIVLTTTIWLDAPVAVATGTAAAAAAWTVQSQRLQQ